MFIVTCALLALIPAAHPGQPAPSGAEQDDWQWPLRPTPRVLRGYDPPPQRWLSGHRGVDLAARPGQPVYAAGAGRVGYAGRLAGQGVVTVLHGALRTTYLPVRPSVRPGEPVALGHRLGSVEDVRGHCGQYLCLHWGLRRGLTYLDPLSLLGIGTIRLLPRWTSPADHDSGSSPPATAAPPTDAGGTPIKPVAATMASATMTAGGGAVAGAILAYGLTLAWRRLPSRRRLPPGVIDFTRERRRRRHTPA
jgi:murein DD-endopeptidase MepM/ murein hydrolase activator NlpD